MSHEATFSTTPPPTTTTTHASLDAPSPGPTGREASPPPASGPALAWARDFAIVGGVSAFMTPFMIAGAFVGTRYLVYAAAGGIIGGFFLGLLFGHLLGAGRDPDDAARRTPVWILALAAPVLGAIWGASVGLVAALGLPGRSADLVGVSMTLAAIAGALQLGWLWAGYLFARLRRHATWPVVVAACLLPIVGTAALDMTRVTSTRATSDVLFDNPRD